MFARFKEPGKVALQVMSGGICDDLIRYSMLIVRDWAALQGEIGMIQILQLKKEREKKSGDYGNC